MRFRAGVLGLDSARKVERQKFSEPLVAHRTITDPLDDVQIRCLVDFDHAWPAVKYGDVPANHHLVGECAAMGISDEID